MNHSEILTQKDILIVVCSYLDFEDVLNLCKYLKIRKLDFPIHIKDQDQQIHQIDRLDEFTSKMGLQIQKHGSKVVFAQSVKDKNISHIRFLFQQQINLEQCFNIIYRYCSTCPIGAIGSQGPIGIMGSQGVQGPIGIMGAQGALEKTETTDLPSGGEILNFLLEHEKEIFPLNEVH